jgi:sialidase-1
MVALAAVLVGGLVGATVASSQRDLPASSVFYPNLHNISCYRIPSIVQTGSGALLAFAEARHGSCGDGAVHEIAMRRSTDGGQTWGGVTFVAGGDTQRVGNPAAAFDSVRNRVVLLFTNIPYLHHTSVTFSSDDGATFTSPKFVDFGAANGSLCGPGTALQSKSGRLIVASHHMAYQYDLVTYSDDGGEKWTTINQTFPKMDEAAITQLPNGSLLLSMRHGNLTSLGRGEAISTDDGLSFGPIRFDGALRSPVCQASIASFGGATYFSTPTCRPNCNNTRANLTIFRSIDSAATWPSQLLVTAPPTFGYSCLVKGGLAMAPGNGGILYEASGSVIAFSRFPLDLKAYSAVEGI